jgi:hypothetical protein
MLRANIRAVSSATSTSNSAPISRTVRSWSTAVAIDSTPRTK